MNQHTQNHDPEDRGLSIVLAGLLCLLLTAWLCIWMGGERAPAPVGLTGSSTRCVDATECPTGWLCERGRCERPGPRLACVLSPGGPL